VTALGCRALHGGAMEYISSWVEHAIDSTQSEVGRKRMAEYRERKSRAPVEGSVY
jgi:hypothetical protein